MILPEEADVSAEQVEVDKVLQEEVEVEDEGEAGGLGGNAE